MNILLTGATGFIGSHILTKLLDAGYEVVAAIRYAANLPMEQDRLHHVSCDFERDISITVWEPRLKDIDIVINAVGIITENRHQTFDNLHTQTPIALFHAAEKVGIKKVIQISALGAAEDTNSLYFKSKHAADRSLQNLSIGSVIIRPSIVIGKGGASTALFSAMAILPMTPLIGKGDQVIQPVSIDDLSEAVLRVITRWPKQSTIINAVGPDVITMKTLYTHFRHWLVAGKAQYIEIPKVFMHWVAGINQYLKFGPLTPETLAMLETGNTADSKAFASVLGRQANSLQDTLAMHPTTRADRQAAGLFFLSPVLSLSLAFLWLLTAWVSAFVYPVQDSYALLDAVGIGQALQPLALYGAALLDGLIGLAFLLNYKIKPVALLSFALIAFYTIVITVALPEYWWHPYGPLSKNIPIMVATLMVIALNRK